MNPRYGTQNSPTSILKLLYVSTHVIGFHFWKHFAIRIISVSVSDVLFNLCGVFLFLLLTPILFEAGLKQVCSWLATCFRPACDQFCGFATCFRGAFDFFCRRLENLVANLLHQSRHVEIDAAGSLVRARAVQMECRKHPFRASQWTCWSWIFVTYFIIRAYHDVIKWKNAMQKLDFTPKNLTNCVDNEPTLWDTEFTDVHPEIAARINSYHWLSFLEA